MYLRRLELEEFRSYRRLELELPAEGLRIIGANASGKSTLLEAISMLATTRSSRSNAERELINWDSGTELGFPPYARVRGTVRGARAEPLIEITLQADEGRAGLVRKQIKMGSRPRRAMDVVGTLRAVLFSPEDVALVAGSPGGRRRYLDMTLSQLDAAYMRALSRFSRVLTQRNSLLKALGRDRVDPRSASVAGQLGYWDSELVALGSAIIARRFSNVARLDEIARDRFHQLTGSDTFSLHYGSSFPLNGLASKVDRPSVDEVQGVVSRQYEIHLDAARADELRRGVSLVGPHRDDVTFSLDGIDLAAFGSRGQQRLAVVALKLAEAGLMAEVGGEPPVLLLDDALSELDAHHRSLLTTAVADSGGQIILTTTDLDVVDGSALGRLSAAGIANGAITEMPRQPERRRS